MELPDFRPDNKAHLPQQFDLGGLFNAYISVLAIQQPQWIMDLLAYFSIITKAAHDYAGTRGYPMMCISGRWQSMRLHTWV